MVIASLPEVFIAVSKDLFIEIIIGLQRKAKSWVLSQDQAV